MSIKKIYLLGREKPTGHYSPAIVHNNTVYVSGQLAIDKDGVIYNGDIETQTKVCMNNIKEILEASGSDLQHVLKVNVFLTDINLWGRFNAAYAEIMGEHRPARIAIPSGELHYGCSIEIDCIAAVK